MQRHLLNGRLSFLAEWYQEEAEVLRQFLVVFYTADNALEVIDQRSKRIFMRRTKMPELRERDFFIGSKINVFGRQFAIIDYADEVTRNTLAKCRKTAFMLVKHSIREQLGLILSALIDSNYNISQALMVQFSPDQAKAFLNNKKKVTSVLVGQLLAGPVTGFKLIGDNGVDNIKACRGECNPENFPPALVRLFSQEGIKSGIYSSDNDEEAAQDLEFFFGQKSGLQPSFAVENSTLAIIKPHCIKEGNLGKVISEILSNGFKITGLRMTLMERINCEEFLEVYNGILPEYNAMLTQLASGMCLALVIVCKDESKNSHEEFRKFCGPIDPEIAKLLRPNTLRAKFGVTKVLNAVHCTDLPEDTKLEIQYLFKILD